IQSDADPYDVFLRLRRISPSPFGAYIDLNGIRVISSSMELLLDVSNGKAWTRPIKGTVPRTGDIEKDGDNLQRLLSSEKDRSELLMVTDMERNDMNRFCVPGSVEVKGFFHPEEYSTLYHTVSDVTGTVEEGTGIGRMVECMFPADPSRGHPSTHPCWR
ncbi:MAG: chorismate-binding protein, partial [Candidatus Methanomethylophilaceae archaeon]|nr:chorismate-binding protein [Candidatus Methanomethylophilaceae archaeon]